MMPRGVVQYLDGLGAQVLTDDERAEYQRDEGVTWEEFARLLDQAEGVVGDRDALVESLAGGYLHMPDLAAFRGLVRTLAGPVAAYRLMDRMGPRSSPVVQSDFRVEAPGRIRIDLRLVRATDVPSPLYFDITGALLARLPVELMGLPRSRVEIVNHGVAAEYVIHAPRSWSVFARCAAAWRAFWGSPEALEIIGEEQARARSLYHTNTELQAHSAEKSRHLADMSHELRTPLNAIIGYAELLGEEVRDAGIDDLVPDLVRIETAAHYLLRLINGVLDLSKIEAGRLDVRTEDLDLHAVATEVAVALEPVVRANGSTLQVSGEPCAARGDGHRVRQILTNLIGNAAKFTREGRIEVRVTCDARDASISVTDTGVGIAPDALETLFVPYKQASADTAEQFGGTGLGLSIALRLAELMDGGLTVQSTPGEGSTFTLRLPRA